MLNIIRLIECFRTFQGEGPDSGRAMMLLRFKHCDQNCFFCDTKVKMRISEEGCYTINQIQDYLDTYRCGLMITGGEPTFSPHYAETITLLTRLRYRVANVETNGCQLEKMLKDGRWFETPVKFIYSPKIFDEKSLYKATVVTNSVFSHPNVYIKIPYLKNGYVDKYCKWLVKERRELENHIIDNVDKYCKWLVKERRELENHIIDNMDNKIWLMPIGDNEKEQKKSSHDVMDCCEYYNFNFSGRTHIMYDFI